MDDRRFDSLVRSLGAGCSRKTLLKGILGIGVTISSSSLLTAGDAAAARRGFSGPQLPTPPPPCVPVCDEGTCGGPDGCGNTCECAAGYFCQNGGCCEDIQLTEPGCFWMELHSGFYCWVQSEITTYASCEQADSCSKGGACYKWALSSNTQIAPPWK